MYPELPGGLPTYAAVASIATTIAVLYNYFRLDQIDLEFKTYALYCLVSAACCAVVAKLVFAISILPTVGFTIGNFFHYAIFGGIVFYGGLFGLSIGILLVSRFLHRDGMTILNFFSPSFPLFHAIARVACLRGGCCYGIPWSWGVVMAETPDVIRFPVQIAESLCCLIIYIIVTVRAKKKKNYDGSYKVYLFLYAICRFALEFLRGDEDRGIWAFGLSTSQIISIIIIVVIGINAIKTSNTRSCLEKV